VPKSAVTLVAGQSSRNKTVEIVGINAEDVEKRLMPESGEKGA
jgi:uncharacterized protein YggU (UPF0235/DUF167 family)